MVGESSPTTKNLRFLEFAALLVLLFLLLLVLILIFVLIVRVLLILVLVVLLLVLVLLILILVVHRSLCLSVGCLSKIFVKCRFDCGNAPKTRCLNILHIMSAGMQRKNHKIL